MDIFSDRTSWICMFYRRLLYIYKQIFLHHVTNWQNNFVFLFVCLFVCLLVFDVRRLIKSSSITARNSTHYKAFITAFISIYLKMGKIFIKLQSRISNSFVCLLVILLIFCVIPPWYAATAHSTSRKELNPSSQEDAHFSWRCTSTN